jgi:AAA+ ATPase superfamily predicted ATPase
MSKHNHLENPFNYGQTVEKTSFFDRIKEQSTLRADFLNGQNVIVMAPRRYGKSSLIKKVLANLNSCEISVIEPG